MIVALRSLFQGLGLGRVGSGGMCLGLRVWAGSCVVACGRATKRKRGHVSFN